MIKVVNPLPDDLDAPTYSLLGLSALAAELAAQGVSVNHVFARTGVHPSQLDDPRVKISHRQRLAIYRNVTKLTKLTKRTEIGLLAGARQRLCDFGIYGYAMVSSATFGDALLLSLERVTMAGPAVRQISFSIEDDNAILRSHGIRSLDDLLPFAAEFWRSSMTALFSHVLEAPFPTTRMMFTFPPPHIGGFTNECSIVPSNSAATRWNGISVLPFCSAAVPTPTRSPCRSVSSSATVSWQTPLRTQI